VLVVPEKEAKDKWLPIDNPYRGYRFEKMSRGI
jgi:hypothetical protein